MSMIELGKHHLPKGTLVSPVRKAIVAYLRDGERTSGEILQLLLDRNLATNDGLARNPYWLQNHMAKLREEKHVDKRINDAQQLVWFLGAVEAPAQPAATSNAQAVAAPRQVNVMHGPVYVPPTAAPARAGALDYARMPSLMSGTRVPFRGVA